MRDMPIGLLVTTEAGIESAVERIASAERAGVDVAWMTCGLMQPDPLPIFAAAATRTERIRFGTCILTTMPRHPLDMARSAIVVEGLAPGRLRLGIGPSHEPMVRQMYNWPLERPLQHLREYVTILKTLFDTGAVDFHGERLDAVAALPAPTRTPVMISALRANSFKLAGEVADGAISWVSPIPYLRDVAVPAVRQAAAKAGRPAPPVVAHVPLVVSDDVDAVRQAARAQLAGYPRLPFYSQMFQDAGFPEAADGELSDRMIDALVVHGDEEQVTARIAELPSAAIGELLAMPLVLSEGSEQARERTVELLGQLARHEG